MNSPSSRSLIISLIERWLEGRMSAEEFTNQYWRMRTSLMDQGETFPGRFGEIASRLAIATDRYSTEPDPAFLEIDEDELRTVASRALNELRMLSDLWLG